MEKRLREPCQARLPERLMLMLYVKEKMCKCDSLPEFLKADKTNPYFKGFNRIDVKDDAWVKLIKCPDCGQCWQIDEWDKYQTGLAIKIQHPKVWKHFDDKKIRLEFLVQTRDGLSEIKCAWIGCNNIAIRGLAYCPSCSYSKAKIRE